jgi:RimJ/RimL family protein N-acetyltransferase
VSAANTAPPTLHTERLVLRPLRVDDAAAVAAGAGDKRVSRFLLYVPSPYPVAIARAWIEHRIDWWREGRGATLAIARRTSPAQLVGTVSLRRFVRDRRAELGYWLAAAAWDHGFATEACRAAVAFGFETLGLARIYAQVIEDNAASMRVLDKLGMVREGVKRKHIVKGGKPRDVVIYGLLRDEWAAR